MCYLVPRSIPYLPFLKLMPNIYIYICIYIKVDIPTAQMEAVLDLGVQPERIVLANCCKRPRDIRTACARGVALTTFDTVSLSPLFVTMPPTNHLVGGMLFHWPATLSEDSNPV